MEFYRYVQDEGIERTEFILAISGVPYMNVFSTGSDFFV